MLAACSGEGLMRWGAASPDGGAPVSPPVIPRGGTEFNVEADIDVGTDLVSVKEPPDVETDPNVVVWVVYSPEGKAWQEPLNGILRSKAAPYTVRIVNYFSTEDDFTGKPAEEVAALLTQRRDGGEQTDVISVPMQSGQDMSMSPYVTAAGRGLLLPLDDLLTSARGNELIQSIPARDLARSQIDGATYGISVHRRSVTATAYDKAYLERHHISVDQLSADPFTNEALFQKVRDTEPGSIVPYAYNTDPADALGLWRVTESIVYTPEGRFRNLFELPEFRTYLARLYDWEERGLISIPWAGSGGARNFVATTALVQTDEVFEGDYVYHVGAGKDIITDVVFIPNMRQAQVAPYWGDSQNGVAAWSRNQTYAFDFLTRLYTDRDIANLIQYGVENQTYTLEDGVAVYRGRSTWQWMRENFTNSLLAYPQATAAQDSLGYQERYYELCEPYIPDGFRFDPAPVAEELAAVRSAYYQNPDGISSSTRQIRTLMLLASPSWEADVEDISARLKEAGIDAVIAEAERQLAAWRQRRGA
jgi:hypothetical protein